MPCGVKTGGRKFRVKFCDFKACLFGLYFVRNFAEFQSRIYVFIYTLLPFGSFLPRLNAKILRLILGASL